MIQSARMFSRVARSRIKRRKKLNAMDRLREAGQVDSKRGNTWRTIREEGSSNCRSPGAFSQAFHLIQPRFSFHPVDRPQSNEREREREREELGVVDNYFLFRVSVSAISSRRARLGARASRFRSSIGHTPRRMVFVRGYLSTDDWNVRASANRGRLIPFPLS